MPNFRVFNDVPSALLSQVSQPTAGCLQVATSNVTVDTSETVVAGLAPSVPSTTRDILAYSTSTFAAFASGTNNALVRLQISTDGTLFTDDIASAKTVTAGPEVFFVPVTVTRYAR